MSAQLSNCNAGAMHCPVGADVKFGEGLDPVHEPIPTRPEEVDAFFCLRFLRAIRDVAFATVDADGMPGVRIVDVMAVEPGRLFFLAPRGKAFHDDLVRSGTAALVGQTPDLRTCRLRGRVVHPSDPSEQRRLIDMMFELNPSMNVLYPGDARSICDAFYIENGEGEYYDLGQRPLLRVPFSLGATKRELSGRFVIGDACTGCGRCVAVCPTECIERVDEQEGDRRFRVSEEASKQADEQGQMPSGAGGTASSCIRGVTPSHIDDAASSGTDGAAASHVGGAAPFRIRQEHCLRCGLCAEACPAEAIEKTSERRRA